MTTTVRFRGDYVHRDDCRLCGCRDLVMFLDFGEVPLAGGFLREEEIPNERFYPLGMYFCPNCTLVQVCDVVPAEVLFRNYFYYSSAIGTLVAHFRDFAAEMHERFGLGPGSTVVEIGCNDGVFLRPMRALGACCVGVDPATNVVRNIVEPDLVVVNDFFGERVGCEIAAAHGGADAVVSSYSFAHVDDMADVMRGVKAVLKPGGIFVFEVYYLGIVLEEVQYDMMYHEHMSYYSLASLTRLLKGYDMEIFDVRRLPLRAGTIRYYARNLGAGREPVAATVPALAAHERERGFHEARTYLEYGDRVRATRAELMALLTALKRAGKRIIGYGASGRATMIMNFCGIDGAVLDFVVDDAPAKHGLYMPGTHVPIRPWKATEATPPDYALLFAWSFADEVRKRRMAYLQGGGKFIVPLPRVRVMSA